MDNVFLRLAERVESGEIIYFLVIVGLFGIITIQEVNSRRKDKLFSELTTDLMKEIHAISNQITQLTGIVNFLALNRKFEHDEVKK